MGNEPLSLAMRVDDWLIIDATIDNKVAIAAADGDEPVVRLGTGIREAGWAATRAHPRNQDGWGGWPSRDDELTVAQSLDAWRFVVQELHRWASWCLESRCAPHRPAVKDNGRHDPHDVRPRPPRPD